MPNPDGGWEEVTDPSEAKKVLGADTFASMQKSKGKNSGLSQTAQKFLNELSQQAADAQEAQRIYQSAVGPIRDFRPSPGRGRFFQMMTPEEGGGFLDTVGGIVGAVPRITGAITPKETDAYQTLRGYQSQQVLRRQLEQKGPQTESDAARLALTELSPSKSTAVNMDLINKGVSRTQRAQARAAFYTRWTQKYGLNGVDPQGHSADELWAKASDYIVARLIHGVGPGGKPPPARRPGTGIRVISRTPAGTR